jgi:arginyl-tRNA synthetase
VRSHVDALVREALTEAIEGGLLRVRGVPAYAVHEPADPAFGDLTCDVAMRLAREIGQPPHDIAGVLLDRLRDPCRWLSGVEVAGPGFVNFRLGAAFWRMLLGEAVTAGRAYGHGSAGRGRRARVLQVAGPRAASAGRPSLAQGRCAVLAGSVARLLEASGWAVEPAERMTARAEVPADPACTEGVDLLAALVDADDGASAARLRAAVDPAVLRLVPVAPVGLARSGEMVRSADVGWPEVVREIGDDVAGFFLLLAPSGSALDLDLEQAKRRDADNPLSRVQLAHARLAGVLREAELAGVALEPRPDLGSLGEAEAEVLRQVVAWPDVVERATRALEPHAVVGHALTLAAAVHRYYNRHRMLTADGALTQARLALGACAKHVLCDALGLCGVAAAGQM